MKYQSGDRIFLPGDSLRTLCVGTILRAAHPLADGEWVIRRYDSDEGDQVVRYEHEMEPA